MGETEQAAHDAVGLEAQGATNEVGQRNAIVVLGMHRSGTSAVSRAFSIFGLALPRTPMEPKADNPLGFWGESAPIVELNEEVLASAGSSWDDVAPFPPGWALSPAADDFKRRMLAAIESEYPGSAPFVLKDPRICRLLPFWFSVFEQARIDPAFVMPIRNPLEVAASLSARNGFSTSKGLLLWLRHVLDAERETRGRPRAFVSYEMLLRDWRAAMHSVSEGIDQTWAREGHQVGAELDRFLSTEHRHHAFSSGELDAREEVVSWVARAYGLLDEACGSGDTPDSEELDAIATELANADRAYGPLLAEERLDGERRRDEAVLDLEGERDHLRQELEERLAEHEKLEQQLNATHHAGGQQTELLRALRHDLDERDARLAELSAQVEESEARIAAVESERDQIAERLAAAERQRDEATEQLNATHVAGGKQNELLKIVQSELADLTAQLEQREEVLATLEAERDQLRADRAHRERDSQELAERIQQLEAEAGQARAELAAIQSGLAEREASLAEMTTRLQQREQDLGVVEAERDQLRTDRAHREREQHELAQRLASIQAAAGQQASQLNAVTAQVAERDERIADLSQHLGAREEKVAGLESEREELRRTLSEQEAERQTILERVRVLELQDAGQSAQLDQLRAELDDREGRIEELNGRLSENDQLLGDLRSEREELQADLAGRESELATLRQKAKQRDQQLGALDRERTRLAEVVSELQAKGQALARDRVEFHRDRESLRGERDELAGSLKLARAGLERAEAQISKLTDKGQGLTIAIAKRSEAISALKEERDRVEQTMAKLRAEREALAERAAAASAEARSRAERIEQIEAALTEANETVERLRDEVRHAAEGRARVGAALQSAETESHHLREEGRRLQAAHNDVTGRLAHAEALASEREQEVLRLGRQIDDQQSRYERLEAALRTETGFLRNELRQTRNLLREQEDRRFKNRTAAWWKDRRAQARQRRRTLAQIATWFVKPSAAGRPRHLLEFVTIRRAGRFDDAYYRRRYPDVRDAEMNALAHYLEYGARALLDPAPGFSTAEYLERHPDLVESGINPLYHAIRNDGSRRLSRSEPRAITVATGESIPAPEAASPEPARSETENGDKPTAKAAPVATAIEPRRSVPQVVVERREVRILGEGAAGRLQLDQEPWEWRLPASSSAAIATLEFLRSSGATHLIVAAADEAEISAMAGFERHLAGRYPKLGEPGVESVYELTRPMAGILTWSDSLREIIRNHNDRHRTECSILDWGTGLGPYGHIREAMVTVAAADTGYLPYLDDTFELVAIQPGSPDVEREAARVARSGIVRVSGPEDAPEFEVQWLITPEAAEASISIVIPTYNGAKLVETCLRGLYETLPRHLQVETIVVDDGSTDDTEDVVSRWRAEGLNATLVRTPSNSGFVDACNFGAASSSGDVIVFLNNDTIPLPGWLTPLVDTLVDDPSVGAVGGRLLYPDGRLQEAGGIIFNDGSGANFGKGHDDPDMPLFTYRRDVHYCSGALLAVRRSNFERLGGFDAEYRPCYYEDTDLCFRLRDAGLRTVYQPASTIVHLEGATAGVDTTSGPKRHQAINHEKFLNRWTETLEQHPDAPSEWGPATWFGLARAS